MTHEPRTISVPPDSALARALRAATGDDSSFVADIGNERYLVSVIRAAGPNAEQVARSIAGIRAAAGAWAHHDTAALKSAVRARRRSGSKPSLRW